MSNSTTTDHPQDVPSRPSGLRLALKLRVEAEDAPPLIEFLHQHCDLSKQQLKDAANKGAVLLRRAGSVRRLRRARAELRRGDRIELHYDARLLALAPPPARCVRDAGDYSVWFKPAGMLAQGNEFGDHCALTRVAELAWQPPRQVWLVHRLDREATGLMLLAHSKRAAAALSRQFQADRVQKDYRVQVVGDLGGALGSAGRIDRPLDGKSAVTEFKVMHWDAERKLSTLEIRIRSGRLHQIRRHLADAGFPVLGDPRYGRGNKDAGGLRLAAVGLRFTCPLSGRPVEFRLEPGEIGF